MTQCRTVFIYLVIFSQIGGEAFQPAFFNSNIYAKEENVWLTGTYGDLMVCTCCNFT